MTDYSSFEQSVSVTAQNILDGEPNDTSNCPIAQAFWQMYILHDSDIKDVEINAESVSIKTSDGIDWQAPLPPAIQFWIVEFDDKAKDINDELYSDIEDYKARRLEEFLPVKFDLVFHAANLDQDEDVSF